MIQPPFRNSAGDVVCEFFHALHDPGFLLKRPFGTNFIGQLEKVFVDIPVKNGDDLRTGKRIANLRKQPRIPNRSPTDHQTCCPGLFPHRSSSFHRDDAAIGNDRKRQTRYRGCDLIGMDVRLIFFLHRPPVNRQSIDGQLRKDRQKPFEFLRSIKTDSCFQCKRPGNNRTKSLRDPTNQIRIFQKRTACLFAADRGCRAAEIHIHSRTRRERLNFESGSHEMLRIIAYHLGDDRLLRFQSGDGPQDDLRRMRIAMDPEILRHIYVRTAPSFEAAPERKDGNILHRSEDELRRCDHPTTKQGQVKESTLSRCPPLTGSGKSGSL